MDDLMCPSCGEDEQLLGEQHDDGIVITCQKCGTEWPRDFTPRCTECNSEDVRLAFQVIVEKSRGTQLSMQSLRRVYLCSHCDTERLAEYQVSNRPLAPDELPIETDL